MLRSQPQRILLLAWMTAQLAACTVSTPEPSAVLKLATTTSTYDSGLLDAILPAFEQAYRVQVDVIAVGTGQAMEIGKSGDVDVILVHNRALEDKFVADGYGVERFPVMFNDFVLVGPPEDPAGIGDAVTGAEALRRIFDSRQKFISRGDDSGTYAREQALWQADGLTPTGTDTWYLPIGQGMGETLEFAEEQRGYTLTDRGTYLSMAEALPDLTILFGGATLAANPDPAMRNPYGVIQVMPDDPQAPAARRAAQFIDWLTSEKTQERIASYGVDQYGQPLFYPSSIEWCESHGADSPGCSD